MGVVLVWVTVGIGAVGIDGSGIYEVVGCDDSTSGKGSSGTPAAIEKSPLDFTDEDPPPVITEMGDEVTAKAILESVPKKESTLGGKSLTAIKIEADSTGFAPATQETPMNVSDPDPSSSSRRTPVAEDPDSEKSTSFTSMVGSPGNARLDALSIDFDEELYPHMLTAIAGCRWVIEYGLRLAVIKCTESTELRQVFANVVSAGIAKRMSEGLKHGVEHGKAKVYLAAIEAYNPEADTKYVAALHALKDLKYPLVDQLEKLKDAFIDVIMASLFMESDSGEDAP
nr:hypothetical protein [Tanacetum cinerariifolium]